MALPPPRAGHAELDDTTLARAQRGEAAAFRVLVERYQDPVFALLWRFLGRRARAELIEDVAQDTFLGVFQSLPRFRADGPARLSTWILTIATRTAIKATRAPPPPTTGLDAQAEAVPGPAAATSDARFIDALSQSLATLATPHRIAFLLRAYHDFSYDEIADALEIDLGTVKSRLARARAHLQSDLEDFAP